MLEPFALVVNFRVVNNLSAEVEAATCRTGSIRYIVSKILYCYRIENMDIKDFHIVVVSKVSEYMIKSI